MGKHIRRCENWHDRHERPQYTLQQSCPECAGPTEPAAPARYVPGDPYGEYRRAFIRRHHQ